MITTRELVRAINKQVADYTKGRENWPPTIKGAFDNHFSRIVRARSVNGKLEVRRICDDTYQYFGLCNVCVESKGYLVRDGVVEAESE